jgi:hypothetical protein
MKRINAFAYNTHSIHYYSTKHILFRLSPHPDRPLTHDNRARSSLEDSPPFHHFLSQSHHFHRSTQLPLQRLLVPPPLPALLLRPHSPKNSFPQAPIAHRKTSMRPSSTKELTVSDLFHERINESFYKEKIFET